MQKDSVSPQRHTNAPVRRRRASGAPAKRTKAKNWRPKIRATRKVFRKGSCRQRPKNSCDPFYSWPTIFGLFLKRSECEVERLLQTHARHSMGEFPLVDSLIEEAPEFL